MFLKKILENTNIINSNVNNCYICELIADKLQIKEIFNVSQSINNNLLNQSLFDQEISIEKITSNSANYDCDFFIAMSPVNYQQHIINAIENGMRFIIAPIDLCVENLCFSLQKNLFEKKNLHCVSNAIPANECINNNKEIVIFLSNNVRQFSSQVYKYFYQSKQALNSIDFFTAVTGTNGKSSTVDMARQLFGMLQENAVSIGTLGVICNIQNIEMLSCASQNTDTSQSFMKQQSLNLQKIKYDFRRFARVEKKINDYHMTSPDSETLHKILSIVSHDNIKKLCIEASSHGLHQYRLHSLNFNAVVFTNFTQDHLDYHKTMDEYFSEKLKLFTQLSNQDTFLILNSDDQKTNEIIHACRDKNIILYGSHNSCVKIQNIRTTEKGKSFEMIIFGKKYCLEIPVFANFQIYNFTSALLIVITNYFSEFLKSNLQCKELFYLFIKKFLNYDKELDISDISIEFDKHYNCSDSQTFNEFFDSCLKNIFEKIYDQSYKNVAHVIYSIIDYVINALSSCACGIAPSNLLKSEIKFIPISSIKGRMEYFNIKNKNILVDFAHTADALEKLLQEVSAVTKKIVLVFGCGGERDAGKRFEMGKIACKYADIIIITDDNPRGESSSQIRKMILNGVLDEVHRHEYRHTIKVIESIDTIKDIDCIGSLCVNDSNISQKIIIECQDRKNAIILGARLLNDAWLVIAGKGHESTQNINGTEYYFSDQEVVLNYI